MNKRFYSIIFLAFTLCGGLNAQVRVYSEFDKNGNVNIISENTDAVPYTVILDVTVAENLEQIGTGSYMIAYPGKAIIAKLRKKDEIRSSRIHFKSRLAKGMFSSKNQKEIPFLLPVSEGEDVSIMKVFSVKGLGTDEAERKQSGVIIYLKNPAAICAPRRSIVSDIKDDSDEESNFIELYHDDGSFTMLRVFKAGSLKVNIGDTVFPGMELAESVDENFKNGPQVRMTRKILKIEDESLSYEGEEVAFVNSHQSSIKPENGVKMVSVHPENWIKKEMSKREVKRYESGKL